MGDGMSDSSQNDLQHALAGALGAAHLAGMADAAVRPDAGADAGRKG